MLTAKTIKNPEASLWLDEGMELGTVCNDEAAVIYHSSLGLAVKTMRPQHVFLPCGTVSRLQRS